MGKRYVITAVLRPALLLFLPLVLAACGGSGGQGDPPGTGVISGRLTLPQQNGLQVLAEPGGQLAGGGGPAPIAPGEVLVSFNRKIELTDASVSTLSAGGVQLKLMRGRDVAGYHHYAAAGLDEEQTRALIQELNGREDVAEAIPNWILSAYRTPDDPMAYLQWHYAALNLPVAWDIETGQSHRITVAVVDSGGITDPNLHPDLSFVGGYNFVSGANHGGPSTGWGPDFMDYSHASPDYSMGGGSGFHGLHVAGTIGATTDNGIGLAGVNWNVDLVAVRSLGFDGAGQLVDIYEGAWWAAGGQVNGVPANPNPARVVNMSLGGDIGQPCPQGIAEMFQTMAANGIITVVAAGNENMNTATILPANCPGVITVGATEHTGYRAPYSNFGAEIDVMAPGGNTEIFFADPNTGDQYPAGVLSTVLFYDGTARTLVPQAQFMQGTSMAAPHVAGIVSLMLAENPELSFEQVVTRLKAAGRPLNAAQCSAGNPAVSNPAVFCGTGLVDAAAALSGSRNPPGPNPPGPDPDPNPPFPDPDPDPNPPDPDPDPPGPDPDPPVSDPPLGPGQPVPAGNVYVAALFTNSDGSFDPYRSVEITLPASPGVQLNYVLSGLQPGNYTVAAWQPLGSTDAIQRGDPFAMHPQLVSIVQGQQVTNLDLYLLPYAASTAAEQEIAGALRLHAE